MGSCHTAPFSLWEADALLPSFCVNLTFWFFGLWKLLFVLICGSLTGLFQFVGT